MKTLYVIDVQNDFLLNDGKLNLGHDTKELRERIAAYIKDFKGHVVLTQDTHEMGSCEFNAFPEHCILSSKGWDIVDEVKEAIKPRKTKHSTMREKKDIDTYEVIFKRSFSGTELIYTLDDEVLVREINIVGVCSHICVHDIVTSIVNYAKEHLNIIPKIIIHKDMVDDFNTEMAEFALKRLQSLYGVEVV